MTNDEILLLDVAPVGRVIKFDTLTATHRILVNELHDFLMVLLLTGNTSGYFIRAWSG
ncbi:hypothetical protein [Snodgrassella alvi]|uniref:hypothetical protein n=1 Tax=Snodgrassella alvi TaxID=1196083 RepID=UPI0015D537DB|nr:hypothetical protein [Snodgrassella alvi]